MAVRVDDRDSSISFRKGVWTKHGNSNEYQNTVTLTRMQNTYVEFTFTGTSVAVYGTISDSGTSKTPAVSTYQIDDGEATTYSTPIQSRTQYQQQFFQASGLEPTSHKLLVTITSSNTWFWLDYIEYTPVAEEDVVEQPITTTAEPPITTGLGLGQNDTPVNSVPQSVPVVSVPASSPSVSVSSTSQSSSSSSSSTVASSTPIGLSVSVTSTFNDPAAMVTPSVIVISGATGFVTVTQSVSSSGGGISGSEPTTISDSTPSVPIAAIVGGTLGGVLVLVAIMLLILFCLRRRRKQKVALSRASTLCPSPAGTTDVTPFHAADPFSPLPSTPAMLQTDGSVSGRGSYPYNFESAIIPEYSRKESLHSAANSRTTLVHGYGNNEPQDIYNTTPLPGGKFTGRHLSAMESTSEHGSSSASDTFLRSTLYTDNMTYVGAGFEDSPPAYQPRSRHVAYPVEKPHEDRIPS